MHRYDDFTRLANLLDLCAHTLRLLVTKATLDGSSGKAVALAEQIGGISTSVREIGFKATSLDVGNNRHFDS